MVTASLSAAHATKGELCGTPDGLDVSMRFPAGVIWHMKRTWSVLLVTCFHLIGVFHNGAGGGFGAEAVRNTQ